MAMQQTEVLPGDPKAIASLRRVARDLEQESRRVPNRARSLKWTNPTKARDTLAGIKTLRRLAEAAYALAEAHQHHRLPDLLDGVRKQGQLALLLAGMPETLDQETRKHLADAGIPLARAKEASEQLQALVPPLDPRAELLEDIWLKRIEVGWSYRSDDTPAAALLRALEAADLHDDQHVLIPCAGLGYLAEALADAYPQVTGTMIAEGEDRRALLALLTQAYPGLHLTEAERPAQYATRHERILLRTPDGWRLQDIPIVRAAYHQHLLPGGRLVALMDPPSWTYTSAQAHNFQQWVKERQGRVERLEGRDYRVPLYLLVLEKPSKAQELFSAEG